MSQTLADLLADAEQVATVLEDAVERLHELKRELPDERRDDVLHAADRAADAWASARGLIVALGFAAETPPRSTLPLRTDRA